ncbi:MAG: copper chaperone [Methylococcaceae bacterium]|nr:MAG: copper chaperone [Methylococcaceae bacterium]
MENITINVAGMKCGGCENTVKTALLALDGVAAVEASHKDKTVSVAFDGGKVSEEQIRQVIGANGFQVA